MRPLCGRSLRRALQVKPSVVRIQLGAPVHDDLALARRGLKRIEPPRDSASLADLYKGVSGRYPLSFETLCLRYQWEGATIGEVELADNPAGNDLRDLARSLRYDPILWDYLASRGYLVIGRLSGGRYDPCAFDLSRLGGSDGPIVCVDHEEVLSFNRLGTPKVMSPSFAALLEEASQT